MSRPEGPEERKQRIRQPYHIDPNPIPTQTPATGEQQLRGAKTPVENAADGHDVREHQRHELEGDDSIERNGGADVDEREERGDDARESDGIDGDRLRGMDSRDPVREREAIVTGKGEGLPGGRDVKGDVACDDDDEDEDGKAIDAAGGHDGLEDVDEGEGGGLGEGGVDGVDGEEVGDE